MGNIVPTRLAMVNFWRNRSGVTPGDQSGPRQVWVKNGSSRLMRRADKKRGGKTRPFRSTLKAWLTS